MIVPTYAAIYFIVAFFTFCLIMYADGREKGRVDITIPAFFLGLVWPVTLFIIVFWAVGSIFSNLGRKHSKPQNKDVK